MAKKYSEYTEEEKKAHHERTERYRKAHMEQSSADALRYYYKNKEKCAERAKKWRTINKDYIITKQKEDKRLRKEKAIEYLGGVCSNCNNKYHPAIFEFHHKCPQEKVKDPSKMLSLSWERIKNELDKCVLLCANCHRLIHHEGNYDNKQI
jgi:hypothetical protein